MAEFGPKPQLTAAWQLPVVDTGNGTSYIDSTGGQLLLPRVGEDGERVTLPAGAPAQFGPADETVTVFGDDGSKHAEV